MSDFREFSGLKPALQSVLVIANSGRMLASAVSSAGYHPLVIDLFADQDTGAITEQLWQVDNLSLAVVQEVVEHIVLSYKIQWLVYGSGLEKHQETLEYLADRFSVMGCDLAVIKDLSAKKTFFKQLDTLGIQYPDVQFYAPENSIGWLIKPESHVGGLGISGCNRDAQEGEYYQKFYQGKSASVLFCADGEQFKLIGFHQQWTLTEDCFAFAGIRQEHSLPEEHQKTVANWVKKLVGFYHLKGLAGLDFIYNNSGCFFLEINPRPPASMMLYPELDLLSAHKAGYLTEDARDKTIRALQIVYARQACVIPSGIVWPKWSFDQPKGKTRIQINAPVCSIMAHEKTAAQALSQLKARQTTIENILFK